MKTCSKCGEAHPITFFNKDRNTKDGLYTRCKDCSRKACRDSYRAHEAEHRVMKQRWKAENQERHREINRDWRQANPDKLRASTARYRARLKQATPPWADVELIEFIRSNCPPGWHVDHIHPLAGGKTFCGLNVPWNLQFLPADEHRKKGSKPPVEAGGHYNL
jgi:hypothetical protein